MWLALWVVCNNSHRLSKAVARKTALDTSIERVVQTATHRSTNKSALANALGVTTDEILGVKPVEFEEKKKGRAR